MLGGGESEAVFTIAKSHEESRQPPEGQSGVSNSSVQLTYRVIDSATEGTPTLMTYTDGFQEAELDDMTVLELKQRVAKKAKNVHAGGMELHMEGELLDDTWKGVELGIHDGCEIVVSGHVIEDACLTERVLRDMRSLKMSKTERVGMIKEMTGETGMLDSRQLLIKLDVMLTQKRQREDEQLAFATDPTAHVLQKLDDSGLSADAKEKLIDEMEDDNGSVDLKALMKKLDTVAQWKKSIDLVHIRRVQAAWHRWHEIGAADPVDTPSQHNDIGSDETKEGERQVDGDGSTESGMEAHKPIGRWVERIDEDSGRSFYENEATGEMVWEQPEGFDEQATAAPSSALGTSENELGGMLQETNDTDRQSPELKAEEPSGLSQSDMQGTVDVSREEELVSVSAAVAAAVPADDDAPEFGASGAYGDPPATARTNVATNEAEVHLSDAGEGALPPPVHLPPPITPSKAWPDELSSPQSWRKKLLAKQSQLQECKENAGAAANNNAVDVESLRMGMLLQKGTLSVLRLDQIQRQKNGGAAFHEMDADIIAGNSNVLKSAHEHLKMVNLLEQRPGGTRRVRVNLGDGAAALPHSPSSPRPKTSHIKVQGKGEGESYVINRDDLMKWYQARPLKDVAEERRQQAEAAQRARDLQEQKELKDKLRRYKGWLELSARGSSRGMAWNRRYFRIEPRSFVNEVDTLAFSRDPEKPPKHDKRYNQVLKGTKVRRWTKGAWSGGDPRQFQVGRWRLRALDVEHVDACIAACVANGSVESSEGEEFELEILSDEDSNHSKSDSGGTSPKSSKSRWGMVRGGVLFSAFSRGGSKKAKSPGVAAPEPPKEPPKPSKHGMAETHDDHAPNERLDKFRGLFKDEEKHDGSGGGGDGEAAPVPAPEEPADADGDVQSMAEMLD